jgi:hypothetical protein
MSEPTTRLRQAAAKLRALLADLGDNRGPWIIDKTAKDYPQEISNVGVPYVVATTYDGPQGPLAAPRWITTMHPGVGVALAAWLEFEAKEADLTATARSTSGADPDAAAWLESQTARTPHALAVADAILGPVTQ